MAFQPDPHRSRRRRRSVNPGERRPRPWRAAILAVVGLAGLAALVALVPALPTRADPAVARTELARSLAQFRRGDLTGARDAARRATQADPAWGLAHATLARYLLDLEDGSGAQAELDRARETGFDPRRAHQLYAQAYLLQGEPERAIAEAAKAPPRYRGYADRIAARALAAGGQTGAAWRALSRLARAEPGNSRVWSDLGRLHRDAGDLAAAMLAADRALALDPTNGDALVLRGQLVRGQFGLVGALPWFEQALRRDPRNAGALVEYAATLGEAGRYRDMLAATRRAIAARPDDPVPYYLQAVLAARAGQDELARGLLDRTGGRLAGLPGALLLGGALDYGAGAWQQAVSQWGDLVGQQPKNIVARRLLAAALLRTGDSQGALDVLRPVALRDDADSYALDLVGRAFERRGERDWAARFLDRAASPAAAGSDPFGSDRSRALLGKAIADTGTTPASIELIRALLSEGNAATALTQAQRIARANPGAPAARLVVGDIQAAQLDWRGAADSYRAAAGLRFDEPTALRLIDAQQQAGDRAAAANTLALFLSQNPTNVAAQRLSAQWQVADGDWDAAIDTLESLRQRLGNRDAALLAALGYAFVGKGDAAGGESYAAAAYRLAPANPAAADAWGWALYNLGDYDRAGQLLEKAVSLAPDRSGPRWRLAQTYWALDLRAKAAAQARIALLDRDFGDRAAAERMARGQDWS